MKFGPYVVLVYPANGVFVSVEVGVWETPRTLVHCLIYHITIRSDSLIEPGNYVPLPGSFDRRERHR